MEAMRSKSDGTRGPYGFEDPLDEEGQSPTPDWFTGILTGPHVCLEHVRNILQVLHPERRVGKPTIGYLTNELLAQVKYIEKTPSIRDVLLSGETLSYFRMRR